MKAKSLKNHQNEIATVMKNKKDTMRWLFPRLKLCYSLFEITPSKIPNHIETSQSTCLANQLTGFHTTQSSAKNICKQT